MEPILLGTTDRTILVFIADPASTDGGGKTGIAHGDITVSYTRVESDNDVTNSDVTSSLNALTNLTDAHNDWGWKEVSSSVSPGLYRLDVADAVFASGAWYAVVQVTITSSLASATPKAFQLVAYNPLDGVRLGLTALPNAAADAAGGLPISDAGGLDLDNRMPDATAIGNLNKSAGAIVTGTVTTGASATSIPTSACSPAGAASDQFKGRIMIFTRDTTTAALRGQATDITASSNSSTPTFTVSALSATPVSGDTFVIV